VDGSERGEVHWSNTGQGLETYRFCLFTVCVCVCVQNGSIMEGLALWKNNVDKRFEGIEDCMICFSVIHGSNYSLPKKGCRTCKKKFHSACLVRHPSIYLSTHLSIYLYVCIYIYLIMFLSLINHHNSLYISIFNVYFIINII